VLKKQAVKVQFDEWVRQSVEFPQNLEAGWDLQLFRLYNYFELANAFREVFKEGTVRIFLFEKLVEDVDGFCSELCDFLGIDKDEAVSLLRNKHYHARYSHEHIRSFRRYRKLLKAYHRLKVRWFPDFDMEKYALLWKGKEYVKKRIEDYVESKRDKPKATVVIKPETARLIHQYYVDSNRRLAESYDLPLAEYGYPN